MSDVIGFGFGSETLSLPAAVVVIDLTLLACGQYTQSHVETAAAHNRMSATALEVIAEKLCPSAKFLPVFRRKLLLLS
jgi:hypothetical protein